MKTSCSTPNLPKLIIGSNPEEFRQMGFSFREESVSSGNLCFDEITLPDGWRVLQDPQYPNRDVIIDPEKQIKVEVFPLHAASDFSRPPFMRLPNAERKYSADSLRKSLAPWEPQ